MRGEGASGDRAAAPRRRGQAHFGDHFPLDVSQTHARSRIETQRLNPRFQLAIVIQLVDTLGSALDERCRGHHRARHTVINTSRRHAVGSSDPQTDPATFRKSILMVAPVPGTPSILVSPWYCTIPPGVPATRSANVPVFKVRAPTVVSPSHASTKPRSMANGTTAARMLPEFGVVSTSGSFTDTCAKRKSMSMPGSLERSTIATSLRKGWAPPMPSI